MNLYLSLDFKVYVLSFRELFTSERTGSTTVVVYSYSIHLLLTDMLTYVTLVPVCRSSTPNFDTRTEVSDVHIGSTIRRFKFGRIYEKQRRQGPIFSVSTMYHSLGLSFKVCFGFCGEEDLES